MPVTLNDMVLPVVKLLGNRSDAAQYAIQAIADSIVELSDNYPFEQLRETGPLVQFVTGQGQYTPEYFMQTGTIGGNPKIFNKVVSWFFYLQTPVNLTLSPNNANNPGYSLIFRDIENLEVLANTISLPQFWSQLGNEAVYVAAVPRQAYYTYMRYQYLHPVTSPVALSTDPLLLPSTWYDILQYSSAYRIANGPLRMSDAATRYHNVLFGDPEFQRSSGAKGQPGLIARRTSQTQKNQSRTTRSVRLVRSSY